MRQGICSHALREINRYGEDFVPVRDYWQEPCDGHVLPSAMLPVLIPRANTNTYSCRCNAHTGMLGSLHELWQAHQPDL
jgi:hypothetical protein